MPSSRSVTIQQNGQAAQAYSVGFFSYTLDDGCYNAQMLASDSSRVGLLIITGADGNISSVQLVR